MSDERRVNGNAVSWGSIKVWVNDEPYYGFTSINFGDKLERVLGYGLGAHHGPRVKSKGKYTVDPCKVTGWVESVQLLRQALADVSSTGNSYGEPEFNIVVQSTEPGKDSITVHLMRCNWVENAATYEENPDPLKEDFVVQPMRVVRNGLVLYDDTDGAPN